MYTSKRVIRPNDEVVRYYCDNGYGLSVACHDGSYGGSEGLYEIALLKGDKIHYDQEWTDVRGWLTKAEVWSWLRIVSEYLGEIFMTNNTLHNVNLTEGQIGVILCSLENSVKYADSEYIAEVDTIFEELEGAVDRHYDKVDS